MGGKLFVVVKFICFCAYKYCFYEAVDNMLSHKYVCNVSLHNVSKNQ